MKPATDVAFHRTARFLLAAIVIVVCGSPACFASDEGDFQFWSTSSVTFDVNKDWKVALEEGLKLGDDAGNLYYHYTDLGFVYRGLADWIDLGFNYKQAFSEDEEGHWLSENRPHFNVTVKGRLWDIDLSDRSRFEFRDKQVDEDLWRYTNQLKAKLPFELTRFKLRPYLADQVYLNLEGQTFEKNRLYSGFTFKLPKDTEGGIYYVWQWAESDGEWSDLNAIGVNLKLFF